MYSWMLCFFIQHFQVSTHVRCVCDTKLTCSQKWKQTEISYDFFFLSLSRREARKPGDSDWARHWSEEKKYPLHRMAKMKLIPCVTNWSSYTELQSSEASKLVKISFFYYINKMIFLENQMKTWMLSFIFCSTSRNKSGDNRCQAAGFINS